MIIIDRVYKSLYVTVNPQNQEISKIRVCEVKYRIEYFIKPEQIKIQFLIIITEAEIEAVLKMF